MSLSVCLSGIVVILYYNFIHLFIFLFYKYILSIYLSASKSSKQVIKFKQKKKL